MENRSSSAVPEELRPLFEAPTAHWAVRAAIKLVRSSDPAKQQLLLQDPGFTRIVGGALAGLDECRTEHILEVVHSFSEKNQPLAHHILLGDSN